MSPLKRFGDKLKERTISIQDQTTSHHATRPYKGYFLLKMGLAWNMALM
jgi:hypothetical protein